MVSDSHIAAWCRLPTETLSWATRRPNLDVSRTRRWANWIYRLSVDQTEKKDKFNSLAVRCSPNAIHCSLAETLPCVRVIVRRHQGCACQALPDDGRRREQTNLSRLSARSPSCSYIYIYIYIGTTRHHCSNLHRVYASLALRYVSTCYKSLRCRLVPVHELGRAQCWRTTTTTKSLFRKMALAFFELPQVRFM